MANRTEATTMAHQLLSQGLVACVQISVINSLYQWQGQLREDHEFRLFCKTSAAHYERVEAAIRALHRYDLPAIYAIQLTEIDPTFARWINDSLQN